MQDLICVEMIYDPVCLLSQPSVFSRGSVERGRNEVMMMAYPPYELI